jgi:hypothetical protein
VFRIPNIKNICFKNMFLQLKAVFNGKYEQIFIITITTSE